jgi:hypothetical protein
LSGRSDNRLKIKINNSVFITCVLVFSGLGALWILAWLPGPGPLRLLLSLLLLGSLYRLVCRHAVRCAHDAVSELELTDDGVCVFRRHGSPAWEAADVAGRFVHPRLVILQLVLPDSPGQLLIPVPWDALEAEAFRALRVHLAMLRTDGPTR